MKENHVGITFCYCFFSLCVVLLHCGHLVANPYVHFFLKSVICRFAVPFFLVTTGYFYSKQKAVKEDYGKKYAKKQGKTYLWWSLIYLPFGFLFVKSQSLPPFLYPVALIFALGYLGTYYHLWYFPALLFGLKWNDFLLKKLKIPWVLGINALLFSLGALETYSSFFKGTFLFSFYESYATLFYTTRNGLFFTPIFLLLGMLIYHYPEKIKTFFQSFLVKIALFSLVLVESSLIFNHPGKDKNFFFFLLFLTPYLFAKALTLNLPFKHLKHRRHFFQQLFFIHPGIIFILQVIFPKLTGLWLFFSVLLTFISLVIGKKVWEKYPKKLFFPSVKKI